MTPIKAKVRSAAALIVLCLMTGLALAHEPTPTPVPAKALGQIEFPTPAKNAQAQAAFIEGMLLLHLFEYTSAAQAFQRAQELEPGFVLAIWGEAMTHTHPVWNQLDLEAGRAALAKLAPTPAARAAKAVDARERDFLQMAEILYGEGSKAERDLRLLAHMEAMATRYPDDDEVQSFLALALLGADQGVRNVPRYLRAAEIAKAVYRRNPQHAGAAHYWIHGMDAPEHAAGALEAARALSKIAPGAGHSQHMTSHIFVALGMWDEVVESNIAAKQVVNADLQAKGRPTFSCGHYTEWLQYAYLQQGKDEAAVQLLEDCARDGATVRAWMSANPGQALGSMPSPAAFESRLGWSLMIMRATAMLAVPTPALRARATAVAAPLSALGRDAAPGLLADGLVHVQDRDFAAARVALEALRTRAAAPVAEGDSGLFEKQVGVMARMLEGAIAEGEGRGEEGIAVVRAAAEAFERLPFDFGPPATVVPPRELLGQMLARAGRKDEARAAFELALKSAPGRRGATQGLERTRE